MALYRFQVSRLRSGDLSRDYVMNTLYYELDDPQFTTPLSICEALVQEVYGVAAITPSGYTQLRCSAYLMSDPEPRPERAFKQNLAVPTAAVLPGPREVALCLSYYADRNLPRQRGRIYVGPHYQLDTRPSTTVIANVMALGNRIALVGGIGASWVIYSPTTGISRDITNYWVDNEWDTVRSRGLDATTRSNATVSPD